MHDQIEGVVYYGREHSWA